MPATTPRRADDQMLRISVIVPALNEEHHLAATLASVKLSSADELIVADGGSQDSTMTVASQFTPHVLACPAGRARQMNRAAQQAQGDILLFLHADTLLPPGGLDLVRAAMRSPQVVGGSFRLAFLPSTLGLRVVAWGTNLRTRFGKLPFGDQALFVRRTLFEALGGYADMPFLEDVWLVRRLRRHGRLALIPRAVHTSGRRWQRHGLVSTTLRNNVVLALYWCGVSPTTLKRLYR
jgi:rSAM/selenodomain-associated transferase 2